jgi:hypothetical protein
VLSRVYRFHRFRAPTGHTWSPGGHRASPLCSTWAMRTSLA